MAWLVQEEDGVSRFTLEEGTGMLLLEQTESAAAFEDTSWTVQQYRERRLIGV